MLIQECTNIHNFYSVFISSYLRQSRRWIPTDDLARGPKLLEAIPRGCHAHTPNPMRVMDGHVVTANTPTKSLSEIHKHGCMRSILQAPNGLC